MAQTEAQRQQFEAQGRQGVVRLNMPDEGVCCFTDLVRGEVQFAWAHEQDHIIQRADGSVLYNLASVVDDFDMGITHVIRSEEHLSNTARQIFIVGGLGYPVPQYAHLPYVAAPRSQEKLSKRKIAQYLQNPEFKKVYEHGRAIAEAIGQHTSADTFNPVIVDFYREVGYVPDALLNYLVLLGWSLDDKTEFFSREEMIRLFSLERVNKAPASFDPKKLFAFQERYMQLLPVEQKADRALPYLNRAGLVPAPTPAEARDQVLQIVKAAGERLKTAGDILDYRDFFTPDDQLRYDEAALQKQFSKQPGAAALLEKYRERLAGATTFDTAALEVLTNDFLHAEGVPLRQVQPLVRLAVTGKAIGFGLYETLSILGKNRCLARIDRTLARL
jgi:glutamyl-tRNA synthetase